MLADDLRTSAGLDLGDLFTGLGHAFTGADFGDVRFDASSILTIVERAAPPDLAGVLAAVQAAGSSLAGRVSIGLPGAEVPGEIERLRGLLSGIGPVAGSVSLPTELPTEIGLDGLLARARAIGDVAERGPLAAVLGLVPGIDIPGAIGSVGGALGGLVGLARVLAGLAATSTISTRLAAQADVLAARLDADTCAAAGARLSRQASDAGLVAALRAADPDDPQTLDRLGLRVVAFLDAVVDVEQRWSIGMGLGEAALLGLDTLGAAAALDLARVALTGADLAGVAELAGRVRALADPLLRLPVPDPAGPGGPGAAAGDVIGQAIGLVDGLTGTVRAWDPATLLAPVSRIAGRALEPLEAIRHAVEAVAGTVASAVRSLRDLAAEVDLTAVAVAITSALQPVVDTLDAIDQAVGTAQTVLEQVCGNLKTGLDGVATATSTAAGQVEAALGRVRGALAALHLADMAETLRSELTRISATLASAQLAPYFDTAIGVIDTGTQVISAVPFGLLPTDVQQEIVDVARPIKQLDLQEVEDTLRAELAAIVAELDNGELLNDIADAYAAVVAFIAELDPGPALTELETGPLAELRATVEGIDPAALLAPAADALAGVSGLLAGIDLQSEVLEPLSGLFTPVIDAVESLDPGQVLAPVRAGLDSARAAALAALHLDAATAAVTGFRDRAAAVLARLDPAPLIGVLSDDVAARLGDLGAEISPPGGALGSLLVTLAQASGLDADEPAIADAIAWTWGNVDGAATVRGRLELANPRLVATAAAVGSLDPAPLAATAAAQHRALVAALAAHPASSVLRQGLDPLLAGVSPAAVLGPLVENRRRYLRELEADIALAGVLAASGRSEVSTAASGLRAAFAPAEAIPARLRAILAGLGLAAEGGSLRDLVARLFEVAGPARIVPAVSGLVDAGRARLLDALDVLLEPVLQALADVRATIDALDVQPVIDEITGLQAEVVAQIRALSPESLLGGVIDAAQAVIDRLAAFDPLAPVQDLVDAAKQTALRVLDTARPTVVFANAVGLHHDVLGLAQGLDVAALLRPVIDALVGLGGQLDTGFDRTGDALIRLQQALPDHVSDSSVGGSVGGSIGGSIGGGL